MIPDAPATETILVVEDDAVALEALVELLEAEGYRVLAARDGVEALALTEREAVDLILSDLRMPRVDGIALVSMLRDRSAEAPVIFMSGSDDRAQRVAAFNAGGDDYLPKPLNPDELLAHLRAHLRRSGRHKRLAQVSVTDELTGVLNRRGLFQLLERERTRTARSGSELSILMIDCNHFKAINDEFGHTVGDEVLRLLATALSGTVRAHDQVARFGGDEFVIVLPDTGANAARALAARVQEACRLDHDVGGGERLCICVAVGAATHVADESIDSLVDRADHAMYAAKRDPSKFSTGCREGSITQSDEAVSFDGTPASRPIRRRRTP